MCVGVGVGVGVFFLFVLHLLLGVWNSLLLQQTTSVLLLRSARAPLLSYLWPAPSDGLDEVLLWAQLSPNPAVISR